MTATFQKPNLAEHELKQTMAKLMDKNHRDSALDITKQVTELSLTVASQKSKQLLDNLPKEYSNNMEQQLWKTCFYNAIETLRKVNIEETRPAFVAFIEAAIYFYKQLIQDYEAKFDISFKKAMFWEVDKENTDTLPPLDQAILADKVDLIKFEGGKAKIALRSAQRHFLALGDLCRYKALINKTDISESKCWYIKAVQANFSNGRSFNQLAVLAVQSVNSFPDLYYLAKALFKRNYLDLVFYYVQALATKYPFESSRESLELVFNDIRNMALSNASDLNRAISNKTPQPTSKNIVKAKKPRHKPKFENKHQEVWIHPINGTKLEIQENASTKALTENSSDIWNGKPAANMDIKLQKQAIIHWLHTLGILITNISMEEFVKESETSLKLVKGILASEDSLATSSILLKLTLVSIFAAHHAKKGITMTMAETQQKYALQYLLDLLSLALDELQKVMDNLGLYLLTGKASDKLERVLPSISTLCNWLTGPATFKILLNFQLKADLLVKSNVFVKLAETATQLLAILDLKTEPTDPVDIYLPELVISSSFHNIFASPPAKVMVQDGDQATPCMLALHARLNSIVAAAEHLSASNLYLIKSECNQTTVFSVQQHLLNAMAVSKNISTTNDRVLKNVENDHSSQEELNDSLIKQLVMDEEESSSQHKWVLEVRPQYLIPDTNTFVDHLLGIKKIVDSKQFTVLVPTTVIAELSSLALDASSTRSFLSSEMLLGDNTQLKYVIKQAKDTLDYLKTASEERCHYLATITSNGNILPKLSFAYEMTDCAQKRTNDDRILAACVTLADKQPRSLESDYHTQTTKVKRHVVFLTEDRALSIKAIAARIPVRTVPEFLKWASI